MYDFVCLCVLACVQDRMMYNQLASVILMVVVINSQL